MKYFFLSLLVIILIITGFFRDYVFIGINSFIKYFYYPDATNQLPKGFSIIKESSYTQLISLKWILTILFTLWYLLLVLGCIKLIFKEKKFLHWTIYVYSSIFILSFLFYFGFSIAHQPELGYRISRVFMGFLQSPFVLMLLIPAFKISKKNI